ncbi:MAG: hypothetical protein ACR2LE_06280 [Nocardioidaceae bacterium]
MSAESDVSTGRERPSELLAVRVAALLVAGEAVALLGLAVAEFTAVDGGRLAVALTSGAFFVLYALGLLFAARGLVRLRRWSRSPVVLAQLIQLGVAWSFHGGSTWWVAALLATAALGVLVVVFSATTTHLLFEDGGGPAG